MKPKTKKLLKEVKEYIESAEVALEWEVGGGRSLEELIEKNMMPDLYGKILKAIADDNS